MGLGGTEESHSVDMEGVVTPIFFRECSSVTEMERENAGRAPGGKPGYIDRQTDRQTD